MSFTAIIKNNKTGKNPFIFSAISYVPVMLLHNNNFSMVLLIYNGFKHIPIILLDGTERETLKNGRHIYGIIYGTIYYDSKYILWWEKKTRYFDLFHLKYSELLQE